jgi:hypothetical protein
VNPKRNAPPVRSGAGPAGSGPARARGQITGANATVKSGPVSHQEALDSIENGIRQLRIDFERFLSGALPFPPEDLRTRIQSQLKELHNATNRSAVEGFRLGVLEARFNSYNELFNRRVREREEGRKVARTAATPPPPRFDPRRGILVDGKVDAQAAEALYTALAAGAGGGPAFDLATFRTYLERQTAALRGKTGCAAVQFRLAEEDGKLKLKARPVTD